MRERCRPEYASVVEVMVFIQLLASMYCVRKYNSLIISIVKNSISILFYSDKTADNSSQINQCSVILQNRQPHFD